jgi:hypothetical protein
MISASIEEPKTVAYKLFSVEFFSLSGGTALVTGGNNDRRPQEAPKI